SRYYYGTPVYNYAEYEYQFNVTHDLLTSDIHPNRTKNNYDYHTGLSTYTSQDIENNTKGITHHAATKRIPAYASTYLLNAVLSGDYVDITGDGPSEDDLGNYVQMNYGMLYGSETNAASFEAAGYKWRNLMDANKADLSLGNKSDRQDDQASFSYGSKEIWYLHSIESKDQVALFYLKRRLDAAEVQSRDGGVSANGARFLYCLDKVEVYARQEFKKNGTGAEPLKVIHFQYSYDLCRNFTGNIAFYDNSLAAKNPMGLPHPLTGNTADFNRGGKLTLHKIWVTYGKQDIPTSAPYVFEYNTPNPNYSYHAVDRWGVYKPHSAGYNNINAISNTDFPYTLQNKDSADMRSQCWMLSDISLPSGGKINIEYESDSYGFVQNKEAMQMLQVKAITDEAVYDYSNPDNRLLYINNQVIPFAKAKRRYLIVKKPAGVSQMSELVDEDEMLHYAFMVQMGRSGLSESDSTYEEVNGFCEIEQVGDVNNTYGFIKLKAELAGMWSTNPIVRNALQQGIARVPFLFYPGSDWLRSQHTTDINKLISMLFGFIPDAQSMLINKFKYFMNRNFCQRADLNRSFVRVKCPGGVKYGGGHRVKRVTISDNWNTMSGAESDAHYAVKYEYVQKDGKTSGVASYEPMNGGNENPFKYPKTYYKKNILGKIKEKQKIKEKNGIQPQSISYDLGPVGEEFFPSGIVGYERVVIRTEYPNENIRRHRTGYTVQEFYTAKDFPVHSQVSILEKRQSRLSNPGSFKVGKAKANSNKKWGMDLHASLEYSVHSQGFVIELNDMHSKPKSNLVFTEDSNEPFSGSRYFYKVNEDGQLVNQIQVIRENGLVENAISGYDVEPVLFGSKSISSNQSIRPNLDLDVVDSKAPLAVVGGVLGYDYQRSAGKTITLTKLVRRTGIVDSVVVYDKGAVTSTKNLAWDALTGQVILTSVRNEYGDNVYSLTKPAHWMYKGIQGAYQNTDAIVKLRVDGNGEADISADTFRVTLQPGDELMPTDLNNPNRVWVLGFNRQASKVSLIHASGQNVPSGDYEFRIIRSGFRNILGAGAESITLKSLPIANVNNVLQLKIPIDQVISGKGVTFDEHRQLYENWNQCYGLSCPPIGSPEPGSPVTEAEVVLSEDCNETNQSNGFLCLGSGFAKTVVNPYRVGILGVWKPFGEYAYHDKRNLFAIRSQSEAPAGFNPNFTNTRTDGLIKNYREFWMRNENGWYCHMEKDTANPWTWMETIHKTDDKGNHVQTVNALGVYSAALYGYNDRRLLIATSGNAKHAEIVSENFEDLPENKFMRWLCGPLGPYLDISGSMPPDNADCTNFKTWPVWALLIQNGNKVISEQSHTGWKSLQLGKGESYVKINSPTGYIDEMYANYYKSYALSDKDFISRFRPEVNREYLASMWVRQTERDQFEFKITDNGTSITLVPYGSTDLIDGWRRYTFRFTPASTHIGFIFNNKGVINGNASEQLIYLDDFRIQPFESSMQTYVYDYRNYRLMSTLDDNNFAIYFEYDEEGSLIRKKVETRKGIMTISENKNNLQR
ncbi:MAG: hypothetical protein JNL57_13320, partial [Bacteroidetes bacterium]|nr:hypothetical protein [Bacteroidota bacterium]